MNIYSKVLVCACAGALVAGCGSAPYRSGKGNDHQAMYRPHGVEQSRDIETREESRVVPAREVVYVREPSVYYQPAPVYYQPAPAYRVVTAQPEYSTVTSRPAYRYVPVTRYYYYTE